MKAEWIRCSEKMPEVDSPVLCSYVDGSLKKRYYCVSSRKYGMWWRGFEQNGEITHWMPLPTFPAEEKK